MVKSIAIYVEGGGSTPQTLDPFRRGMSAFLAPVVEIVRKKRIKWRVIPCGGRSQAYEAFADALRREPDVFNVLLVDGEDQVEIDSSPWTHLKNRQGDGWDRPAGCDDERCQLMVVCMEAWFLADPEALRGHFGGNFNQAALPQPDISETRTKDAIEQALAQATRPTPAKEYKKIRDGAKILEKLNQASVRRHCQWCERLFQAMGRALGAEI